MTKLRWLPALGVAAVGGLIGLGLVTFTYAEGASYLSKDPGACANCHIMQPQYDSWQKASHHTVATCAECHLPVEFPNNYVAKSINGWNHSKAFTLQDFPEPIRINAYNAEILQANCVRCHDGLTHAIDAGADGGAPDCVRCHSDVGHGEHVGLGGPWHDDEIHRSGAQDE